MEDLISTGVLSNQKASDSDDERKLPSWMLPNQLSSMSNINLEENSSKDATQDCSLPQETQAHAVTRSTCKYGSNCYRTNVSHKREFSHPGDNDCDTSLQEQKSLQDTSEIDKPECKYGTACYRQNLQHKRDFKHTKPPKPDLSPSSSNESYALNPRKRKHSPNDDEESDDFNEYDLEDSFIDDSCEDGDSEDEDYKPSKKDLSKDLLDENEWKASPDDSPEVLELLKEARDYLRNKKL